MSARPATALERSPPARPRRFLPRSTRRVFLGTLGIALLAKGGAFLPGFGFDDWGIALRPTLAGALLWQGRLGGAWLTRALQALDAQSVHSQTLWVAIFIAVQALFGTLVARHCRIDRNLWLGTAAAALVAVHPYTCDNLAMRSGIANTAVSQALMLLLLLPERWTPRRLLAGSLLFAVVLSMYQLMLHYLVMVALAGGAVAWGRLLWFGDRHRWSARIRRLTTWRRIARHRSTALLVCAVAGTAIYAVTALSYLAAIHLELTSRTELLPFAEMAGRARQVLGVLRKMLLGPDTLLVRTDQWILLALLALAVIGLVRGLRREAPGRSALAAAAALIGLGAALLWSFGLTLVIREFWPAQRIVAPIAVVWAAAFALATTLNGRLVRGLALAGAGVVVFSFVGIDNRIFTEQQRLNERDRLTASRIVGRLEAAPGFAPTLPLAVHGQRWAYPLPFRSASFDLNISAFGAAWSKAEILREASGNAFAETSPGQDETAAAYCRGVDPFPAPAAVTVRDGLAIVCLQK